MNVCPPNFPDTFCLKFIKKIGKKKKRFLHKKYINISFMPKHKANKVVLIPLILIVNVNPKLSVYKMSCDMKHCILFNEI